MLAKLIVILSVFFSSLILVRGRKHHLEVKNDSRRYIPITNFGFYEKGVLQVEVDKMNFIHTHNSKEKLVGFSLERITNPYTDQQPKECKLEAPKKNDSPVSQIFFIFDFMNTRVRLVCSPAMQNILIYNDTEQITFEDPGKKVIADSSLFRSKDKKSKMSQLSPQPIDESGMKKKNSEAIINSSSGVKCSNTNLTMVKDKNGFYNFSFAMFFSSKAEEGLYRLSYHNCYNYDSAVQSSIEMILKVEARNLDNYLSAGKIPLPALYFMMSLLFFLSALFWFFILRKSKDPVFKLHYLMGVLVIIKSMSLFFHGINYHFIQIKGEHMEAWAVMYYIMHLLKGALLFTVLALIGSGWAFIKHVLSSKEKKIFMMVIPLQIIANVATIIIEETEESNPDRVTWMQLLFLIDFLCCVAILLPVVWSIRHLQEASQTDGKAAISLSKLKLFRHFYIMVVCYIYFTRIIVYLLQITVTFQYEWLDDMFREMATFVFFVMTGYKFRPATNNPYFAIDCDDEEMDKCLTTTGLTENVSRVNQKRKPSATKVSIEMYEDDEEVDLLHIQERSHELD